MQGVFFISSFIIILQIHKSSANQLRYWFRNHQTEISTTTERPRTTLDTTQQYYEDGTPLTLFNRVRPKQIARPLTRGLCSNLIFRDLRTCKTFLDPDPARREMLLTRSRKYLCSFKDRFDDKSSRTGVTSNIHSVGKRSINHCSGPKIQNVILVANEADRPWVVRELLHDPANHLYQTLFVESCPHFQAISGFHCRMHKITFKAAVWSLDINSNDIEVMNLITNGYCALSTI